jgi:hypothetical protein
MDTLDRIQKMLFIISYTCFFLAAVIDVLGK